MGSCAQGPRYYVTRFDVRSPQWARIHYPVRPGVCCEREKTVFGEIGALSFSAEGSFHHDGVSLDAYALPLSPPSSPSRLGVPLDDRKGPKFAQTRRA